MSSKAFACWIIPTAIDKFQWINRERIYWARRFHVPMSAAIPRGFPASTTEVQLALCAIATNVPEKLVSVAEKLFRGFWEDGDSAVLTSAGFLPILEEELGADNAQDIIEQVSNIRAFSLTRF
jgi:hypothetical protein